MKPLHLLLAASAALLLSACGGSSNTWELTPEGIGPVRMGTIITDLPPQCEGLYDTIELEHHDASYDDLREEMLSAYDIYLFKREGVTRFQTYILEGEQQIRNLYVLSPDISYKGVHAGMTLSEAMKAGARFYAGGYLGTCDFLSCFRMDEDSGIIFEYNNGTDAFTQTAYEKLWDRIPITGGYVDITIDYFEPQTKITGIHLH